MHRTPLFLFAFLAALPLLCRSQDDSEDYSSEDVDLKLSRLRLEGAEYLQKVIKQLQSDRTPPPTVHLPAADLYTHRLYHPDHPPDNYVTPVYNITGPTPVPDLDPQLLHEPPPPLPLSKQELLALYQAALSKLTALQLPDDPQHPPLDTPQPPHPPQQPPTDPLSGYYYYYFPINTLHNPSPTPSPATTPPQHLHATITMMDPPNKSMEPLFMAISGFIGMALMFFFSVLFVPKFGKLRSKNAQFKDSPDDVATFAHILLEVMAGRDCKERLACEVVRIFRGIKANNKPLRVLEIILPPALAHQVSLIRKVAGKKAKCEYIPCKPKKPPPKPPAKPPRQRPAPWKKKQTPHDLWMKHFDKGKRETKQKPKGGAGGRKPPTKSP